MASKRPLRWLLCFAAAAVVVAGLGLGPPARVHAVDCQFVLGFARLAALVAAAEGPEKVGQCLENASYSIDGDASQRTTGGLLVWRRADNWTGFTDGYRTWVTGQRGLQTRLNSRRFAWEIASAAALSIRDAAKHTIFQVSTITAMSQGAYDGAMPVRELRTRGDFGLGVLDELDGVMVMLDGIVYRVDSNGDAHRVDDAATTPFAAVTFFNAIRSATVARSMTLAQLQAYLDRLLPAINIPYAIRIDGDFAYLSARSLSKQDKPYPQLDDVVASQPAFEYHDVEGTLVGLRFPSYMDGINVPGYTFNFISKDRRSGGQVVEGIVQDAQVQIDDSPNFQLELPEGGDFYGLGDLAGDGNVPK